MRTVVQIDTTESGAAYLEFLRALHQVELKLTPLKAGDILINGLGIERKTVSDFFITSPGRAYQSPA